MSLFRELKRRNVLRVGAAYVVVAWLAIQIVETIFPAFGFTDAAIRITTIVFAIGLIPTLIFAWAFELTPEGLKKESEVDRSQSITPNTGKKLDRTIMVVLALALVYFAVDKFVLDPQRDFAMEEQKVAEVEQARQEGRTEALVESYGDKSIAVLPFVNMSSDEEQEYFSDGISEELLNLLAKIPELRVISRSSTFSYKGKDIKLAQVAEELNVAHILDGSVRKAGNRVRIPAQLIEARSDTHLWSETYDRELEDIFAIQDEISATVVDQLKITLLGDAPHIEETDPEAYALYLQARHLGRQFTAESLERSIALYEQALAIDPHFVSAISGLASVIYNEAGRGMRPADEGYRLVRELTKRVLELDPENAIAHSLLGGMYEYRERNLELAARHRARAIELAPGIASMFVTGAPMMMSLGRLDEAIAIQDYVIARDPVNPISHYNLGIYTLYAGRIEESVRSSLMVLRLSPDFTGAYYNLSMAQLLGGLPADALESARKEPFEPFRLLALIAARHALGQDAAADADMAKMVEKYGHEWPYNIAYVVAFRGQADNAFKWLKKAKEIGDTGLSELNTQPLFASLHNDPRWLPLLESIGKSPEQLDAIEFEVTLPK